MYTSQIANGDILSVVKSAAKPLDEDLGMNGIVQIFVFDEEKTLKQFVEVPNTITNYGDQYYATKGSGNSITAPTGMRLGTGGATAVSKSANTGTWITTYATGITSSKALSPSTGTVTDKGSNNNSGYRITWTSTWNAGEGTQNSISEVTLVNTSALGDVAETTSPATISRATFTGTVVNKGANDTLVINWQHDFLGS